MSGKLHKTEFRMALFLGLFLIVAGSFQSIIVYLQYPQGIEWIAVFVAAIQIPCGIFAICKSEYYQHQSLDGYHQGLKYSLYDVVKFWYFKKKYHLLLMTSELQENIEREFGGSGIFQMTELRPEIKEDLQEMNIDIPKRIRFLAPNEVYLCFTKEEDMMYFKLKFC